MLALQYLPGGPEHAARHVDATIDPAAATAGLFHHHGAEADTLFNSCFVLAGLYAQMGLVVLASGGGLTADLECFAQADHFGDALFIRAPAGGNRRRCGG